MTSPMFTCDAIYHGFRLVQGAQSPASLTALVEAVVKSSHPNTSQVNQLSLPGEKCQLQCDDEKFLISIGAKKDEGFESDCESSGSSTEDPLCSNTEIKVIKDHVLRLEKLIQEDSSSQGFSSACESSSSLSSGTDSDEESPRISALHASGGAVSEHAVTSASVSDQTKDAGIDFQIESSKQEKKIDASCPSPAEEKPSVTKSQHTQCNGYSEKSSDANIDPECQSANDQFLVSDILFCHVSVLHPRLVVVVVKAVGSANIRGHVFECASEAAAKSLYSHYHSASNKYKLDRYRNSKRKVDILRNGLNSINTKEIDANTLSSNSIDRNINTKCINQINNINGSVKLGNSTSNTKDFNFETKTKPESYQFKRNYINRSLKIPSVNTNNVTHQNGSFRSGGNVKVIQIKESEDLSISSQHTDEHGVTHIEIESQPNSLASNSTSTSDYSSIISLSTPDAGDLIAAIGGLPSNLPTRSDFYQGSKLSNGISSSCPTSLISGGREVLVAGEKDKKSRQRQPPLLLRRDDVTDVSKSDLPKIVDEIPKIPPDKSGRSRKEKHDENKIIKREKNKPVIKSINAIQEPDYSKNYEYRKSAAETSTWGQSHREMSRSREMYRDSRERPRRSHNKGPAPPPPPRRHPSNPSLLLVPTKNGQEPTKSFYPKESHIIRGNKIIRTEYPTFLGWTIGSEGRYAYYGNPHWIGAHEYHAGRVRDNNITPEMRRRSRSKSPARRPTAHKYIDAMTTFNFSEKLKDLSDAVVQTKRNIVNTISSSGSSLGVSTTFSGVTKSHQRTQSTVSAPPNCDELTGLKSVIKKTKKGDLHHDRRVTFSAYATVQVMG